LNLQKSLTHLSFDMGRMSSPFFGVTGGAASLHSPGFQNHQTAFTSRLEGHNAEDGQSKHGNHQNALQIASAGDILVADSSIKMRPV
jgi:hypothetical protein